MIVFKYVQAGLYLSCSLNASNSIFLVFSPKIEKKSLKYFGFIILHKDMDCKSDIVTISEILMVLF